MIIQEPPTTSMSDKPIHHSFNTSFLLYFISALCIGMIAAYLATGFFSNFYPLRFQIILLSLFFQIFFVTAIYFLLDRINSQSEVYFRRDWTVLLVLTMILIFGTSVLAVCWQFPQFFHRHILFMKTSSLPLFFISSIVSTSGILLFIRTLYRKGMYTSFVQSRVLKRLHENMPGICLASGFFFVYFVLAESLNFPAYNTLDQFFDLDISQWLSRLTVVDPREVIVVRAVHPAVLIFLRPVVGLVSIILNGNRLSTVFLISALAGASCVFLFWSIVRRVTKNITYALIMASLLGASTSHLIAGSMLDTYIYSALALILFVFVILDEKIELKHTVLSGVLVFGITITNIAQTCILYFFARPKIKTIIKYVLLVVTITMLLNTLQVWIYPNAKSSLILSNFLVERHYRFNFSSPSWQVHGHILLITKAMALYGIVAPTPFILTHEIGAVVPNFRTSETVIRGFHVASYHGLADITARLWILIASTAVLLFLRDLFRNSREMLFSTGLLLCLGFNFVLHLAYGDDPLLYSADWVYALVLFVSFAFRKWADQKWFQLLLIIFLGLVMFTNLGLIRQILEAVLPYYG